MGSSVRVLAPEVVVLLGALASLLMPALASPRARPGIRRWLGWAALALAVVAFGLELWLGATVATLFSGGVVQDRFALFGKAAILLALAVVLACADWEVEAMPGALPFAFLAALGGMVVASAASVPAVWAGLALAILASVTAAGRRVRGEVQAAVEAALRGSAARAVVLAGALLMLAGLALAYLMATGSTAGLLTLQSVLGQRAGVTLPVALAATLGLGSVAWLLVMAPFRFGGGSLPAASPLGSGVAAGLGAAGAGLALVKLAAATAPEAAGWGVALAVLAGAVALVAGLALAGRGLAVRTWAAVAGCAQLAWVVAGVSAHDGPGLTAALLLLGAAVIALGGLSVLAGRLEAAAGTLALAALARTEPMRAASLILGGLSLAGVAPLAGFFGEFGVGAALVGNRLEWLAALLLVAGLLTVYGVVRVAQATFLEGPEETSARGARLGRAAAAAPGPVAFGLLVCAFGLFANPISGLAMQGAEALGLR